MFKKIVFASGNRGKFEEIAILLRHQGIEVDMQTDHQVASVDETGLSFVENAILKARHAAEQTGLPALADDSGIEIDALDGAPGIYSARYGGDQGFDHAMDKVLFKMQGVEESRRSARFCCVMVLMHHANDAMPMIFQGTWEGRILTEKRGNGGFGYDPIFWDPHYQKSAAEMPMAIKNAISHRAKAMVDVIGHLKSIQAGITPE